MEVERQLPELNGLSVRYLPAAIRLSDYVIALSFAFVQRETLVVVLSWRMLKATLEMLGLIGVVRALGCYVTGCSARIRRLSRNSSNSKISTVTVEFPARL